VIFLARVFLFRTATDLHSSLIEELDCEACYYLSMTHFTEHSDGHLDERLLDADVAMTHAEE
jgi:hypothetical protein